MKSFAVAAMAAGALVALSACSHSAATSAGAAASPSAAVHSAATPSAAPVNCPQAYAAWRHGHAKKFVSAIDAVDSASRTQDAAELSAALKKARSAVAKAARYPMPACADPRGYWTALLMHVNAAAGTGHSPSGRASIALALKGIATLQHELGAELKRTAGVT
jgi:hypothetical protein